jgi:hypothetical protein
MIDQRKISGIISRSMVSLSPSSSHDEPSRRWRPGFTSPGDPLKASTPHQSAALANRKVELTDVHAAGLAVTA